MGCCCVGDELGAADDVPGVGDADETVATDADAPGAGMTGGVGTFGHGSIGVAVTGAAGIAEGSDELPVDATPLVVCAALVLPTVDGSIGG